MTAWRDPKVQPHVRAVAAEIRDRFGMTNIGGWGLRDNVSDHPRGLALDVMTFKGQAVADWAVANAGALNVTYVIWNRKIWSVARSSEGWRNYVGPSPHIDHVHISFSATPNASGGGGLKDKLTGIPGNIGDGIDKLLPGSPVDDIGKIASVFQEFGKAAAWLIQPRNWFRVGLFVIGVAIIWLALMQAAKGQINSAIGMAGKAKSVATAAKVSK